MRELTPDDLTWVCDPALLGFADTSQADQPVGVIGQERALAALDLGLNIPGDGYNIFVMGMPGTGRTSLTRAYAEKLAADLPAPPDWCYVYNFPDPRRPRALAVPPGRADVLRRDMDEFVDDLRREITRVFESDEYAQQRDNAIRAYRDARGKELEDFEREAREAGFTVGRTPAGLILAPTLGGEVMTPQQFAGLPEAQRTEIEGRRQLLERKLEELMRKGHRSERDARRDVQDLDKRVVAEAVGVLIEELSEKHHDAAPVLEYLQQVALDVTDNAELFRQAAMGEEEQPQMPLAMPVQSRPPYERYRVQILTRSDDEKGAPVVFEVDPTVQNLTGRIEYQAQMGALVTDFTMIQAGALHRANGGFLLIDALSLLQRPYAWDALKRCLQDRCVRIESLAEHLGLISTVNLQPEPVPLEAKIILIGSPHIYSLLFSYDQDFARLFRVKADVDWINRRTDDMVHSYGMFIADLTHRENLSAFSAGAVARIIENTVREAEDREKMTAQFSAVETVAREAAFWAKRAGNEIVQASDVDQALRQRIWRSDRVQERLVEYIRRGVIRVETSGSRVGQINGMALISLGDFVVGRPSRITARSFLGGNGVINIEREVKLSGPIHDKGTLIISGFLGHRYAQDNPISCSITLTFEQSYDEIEGDSASSAELYCVLSALSGLPLRQDLAVTGSVDQSGNVQPIGGANRKIEGFYSVCKEVGLTGTQGVIIPDSNVDNLMLDPEVLEAVRAGQFHIYSVKTIDEGIELFTGVPAGELDENGEYPEGSVNRLVHDRLLAMAEMRRHFSHDEEDEEGEHGHEPEPAPKSPDDQPPLPPVPAPEGDDH